VNTHHFFFQDHKKSHEKKLRKKKVGIESQETMCIEEMKEKAEGSTAERVRATSRLWKKQIQKESEEGEGELREWESEKARGYFSSLLCSEREAKKKTLEQAL
jgi:hypothetical protein